jgi:hypothetical protein
VKEVADARTSSLVVKEVADARTSSLVVKEVALNAARSGVALNAAQSVVVLNAAQRDVGDDVLDEELQHPKIVYM